MDKGTEGGVLATVIIAKIICCVGLVLLVTGAMSGLGAWFMDNGVIWLGAGVAVAVGALFLMRGRFKKNTDQSTNSRLRSSIDHRRQSGPTRTAR